MRGREMTFLRRVLNMTSSRKMRLQQQVCDLSDRNWCLVSQCVDDLFIWFHLTCWLLLMNYLVSTAPTVPRCSSLAQALKGLFCQQSCCPVCQACECQLLTAQLCIVHAVYRPDGSSEILLTPAPQVQRVSNKDESSRRWWLHCSSCGHTFSQLLIWHRRLHRKAASHRKIAASYSAGSHAGCCIQF